MMLDFDRYLQHQLYLERLATGGYRDFVLPNLTSTQKTISKILEDVDIILSKSELNDITKLIREQIKKQSWSEITENLERTAVFEAGWQARFLGESFSESLNIPANGSIVSYVTGAVMSLESGNTINAGTWSQFVNNNKLSQINKIDSLIRDGYVKSLTGKQISSQIKKQYNGVIARNAETLTRTGYIHYAAQANERMIQDNTDVLNQYYYVVTFDNRTSDVCINLDVRHNKPSTRFSVGDSKAPMPPLHFSCRTRRIAVPKGWTPEGKKAAVSGRKGTEAKESFERRKDLRDGKTVKYRGRRDKAFKGQVIKSSTSYESWLKQQPEWFVVDTLGKQKAEWFLSGKYNLKSFTDMSGRSLTLEEIRSKD